VHCSLCACVVSDEAVARWKRGIVPPSAPGFATAPTANQLLERQVRALESIAASLEKLANPPAPARVDPGGVRFDQPEVDE
jgi:hypothetical protein